MKENVALIFQRQFSVQFVLESEIVSFKRHILTQDPYGDNYFRILSENTESIETQTGYGLVRV